jgi:hypothetical protein
MRKMKADSLADLVTVAARLRLAATSKDSQSTGRSPLAPRVIRCGLPARPTSRFLGANFAVEAGLRPLPKSDHQ